MLFRLITVGPSRELSSLRELISIAAVGALCDFVSLALFGLVRAWFPLDTPDVGKIVRIGNAYFKLHVVSEAWWIVGSLWILVPLGFCSWEIPSTDRRRHCARPHHFQLGLVGAVSPQPRFSHICCMRTPRRQSTGTSSIRNETAEARPERCKNFVRASPQAAVQLDVRRQSPGTGLVPGLRRSGTRLADEGAKAWPAVNQAFILEHFQRPLHRHRGYIKLTGQLHIAGQLRA